VTLKREGAKAFARAAVGTADPVAAAVEVYPKLAAGEVVSVKFITVLKN
jgi:hypothetical protein